jgi:hypothetical protein
MYRLYMWEYCTDENINLWGLVNKALAEDLMVDSGALDPSEGPPTARKHKHL